MPDEQVPTPETPAAPATPAAEPTMEQQLESLFAEPKIDSPEPPPAETADATAPTQETPAPEPTEDTPLDLDATLKEIPDVEEPKPDAPALSPAHQEILAAFPTPEVARQTVAESQYFQQLNTAVSSGDFETVESMFAPTALEGFMEHIYQKKVASGEWVDRWIADKEGNPTVNHGLKSLQREIDALKNKLAEKDQIEVQQQAQRSTAQLRDAYNSHMNGLFDKIKFSPDDRRWVMADITNRISSDQRLYGHYKSGNMAALNSVFKAAVKEYVTKDQSQQQGRQQIIDAQTKKVPLVGALAPAQSDTMPDDINKVPAEKRDDWMMEKLNSLFRSK